ncbi:MAG TPA: hypothetical protein ENK83_08245 [Aliiroseovarius sp.]|nr:hypothetical protein [Aliiroseovarius sp.]
MNTVDDAYSMSIGLSGICDEHGFEIILQQIKQPDDQDIRLGHDKIYCQHDGLGGYGLVRSVSVVGGNCIELVFHEGAAGKCGFEQSKVVFEFAPHIDVAAFEAVRLMCRISGTKLLVVAQ